MQEAAFGGRMSDRLSARLRSVTNAAVTPDVKGQDVPRRPQKWVGYCLVLGSYAIGLAVKALRCSRADARSSTRRVAGRPACDGLRCDGLTPDSGNPPDQTGERRCLLIIFSTTGPTEP